MFRNEIIDIASPVNTPVLEIVKIIEMILNKKANYAIVKKGANYFIELSRCIEIYNHLSIRFYEDYIKKTIEKYYVNDFAGKYSEISHLDYKDIFKRVSLSARR